MTSAIETINLSQRYGRVIALDSLNLTVQQGSIYGLVGPNGAGKTTTLRILAGLITPSDGEARLMGMSPPVGQAPRLVGYMPEVSGIYTDLRVWEFLDFFARCHGLDAARRRRTVESLLDLVGLTPRRDALVQSLARDAQQRLLLAHTLVHDPPVLLLDEPTTGLDPHARAELRDLLCTLREMGKTVLLSAHILSELAEICNEIGIIERGRMLVSGSVDAVQRQLQRSTRLRIKLLRSPRQAESALRLLMSDGAEPAAEPAASTGGGGDASAPEINSRPPAGLPTIRRLSIDLGDPRTIIVEADSLDDQQQAALLAYLAAKEIAIVEFRAQTDSLEDLFLRLTTA